MPHAKPPVNRTARTHAGGSVQGGATERDGGQAVSNDLGVEDEGQHPDGRQYETDEMGETCRPDGTRSAEASSRGQITCAKSCAHTDQCTLTNAVNPYTATCEASKPMASGRAGPAVNKTTTSTAAVAPELNRRARGSTQSRSGQVVTPMPSIRRA